MATKVVLPIEMQVFENLKAAILERLTHTRFISRKLPISRGSPPSVARPGGYRKDRQVIAPAPLVRTDAADRLKRRLEQAALPAHVRWLDHLHLLSSARFAGA